MHFLITNCIKHVLYPTATLLESQVIIYANYLEVKDHILTYIGAKVTLSAENFTPSVQFGGCCLPKLHKEDFESFSLAVGRKEMVFGAARLHKRPCCLLLPRVEVTRHLVISFSPSVTRRLIAPPVTVERIYTCLLEIRRKIGGSSTVLRGCI